MTRFRDESGSALVAAMVLMFVMLGIGLALMTMSDTQEKQATTERVRESSFGLTEATLDAQVTRVGRNWPSTAAQAFPTECTPATTGTPAARCPDDATLSNAFDGVDHGTQACPGPAQPVWRSQVRDNGGTATQYYRTSTVAAQPAYDANGDGLLWIRAEGRARCKLRTLVTLVRANEITLTFPRLTIAANWFWTNNQGRKVIVDTVGSYAQPPNIRPPAGSAAAPVAVRCNTPVVSPCLKVENGKGQVGGSTPSQSNIPVKVLSDETTLMLKAQARMLRTYYVAGGPNGTCPPNLTGPLIYVEDMSVCGGYGGGNSPTAPGMLVMGRGGISFGGNKVFYGLIYARNENNSQAALVQTSGNAAIQGAIAVDGLGGVIVGASSTNVVFDARVFSSVKALADASPVPGTWRELSPSE